MTERIQIGSKLKTEPYRIQYGTDPTLVLAEFRKKFHQSSKTSRCLQYQYETKFDNIDNRQNFIHVSQQVAHKD